MVESSFCCFFPLIRQGKSMQIGCRAGRKIRGKWLQPAVEMKKYSYFAMYFERNVNQSCS